MKTHFNNNEYAKKMAQKMQRLATCLPPAIPFEKKERKSDKDDDEKEKYKTFEIKINKREKDSEKIDVSVKVFEDGNPEDFCKWYEQYSKVKDMMPLDSATKQIKVIRSILNDSSLETFNNHLESLQEEEGYTISEDDVEDALEKVTLKVFNNDKARISASA